jgi:hypothetical protein
MQKHKGSVLTAALLIVALAALGFAGTAQAKLTGEFTKFAQCPYKNLEVRKCIYAVTESGSVKLGSKKVPIVNPVVLQGGRGPIEEDEFSKFYGATNGVTLSKAAQPVPGGLAGLINCKEITEPFLRFTCELTLENGITGVNSTLELAKPATAIRISENNLAAEAGVSLEMPVKAHLENPFLGPNCYVGSESSPLVWKLTDGSTTPKPPVEPIKGAGGTGEFIEEGAIFRLKENTLVDNTWTAPGVSGCGGPLVELALDPVIDVSAGLPAGEGTNVAILNNTLMTAARVIVNEDDELHP